MSAINIVTQPERIIIASDGAVMESRGKWFPSDGILVEKSSAKIVPIPHLNCVFASRGLKAPALPHAIVEGFESFDDLIVNFDQAFRTFCEGRQPIEMWLAGFGTDGPQVRFIQNAACERGPGYPEPYTSHRCSEVVIFPYREALFDVSLLINSGYEPDFLIESMTKLVAAQRERIKHNGLSFIGCFVQITILTPDRIETFITRRWPEDRIGGLIGAGVLN
jgi:hypothetical protein